MTTPIGLAKESMDYYRDEINKVQKDAGLNAEGKGARLLKISADIDARLDGWKTEVAAGIEKIESDLAALKPAKVSRGLDSETVAALNYQAKIIQSKIAAEGDTLQGFKNALADIVDDGDDTTRQAFIDSFQDLSSLTRQFEHSREDILLDYYHRGKNLMKSPEQNAYEDAITAATGKRINLNTLLMAAERNVAELKNTFSADTFAHKSKTDTPWD